MLCSLRHDTAKPRLAPGFCNELDVLVARLVVGLVITLGVRTFTFTPILRVVLVAHARALSLAFSGAAHVSGSGHHHPWTTLHFHYHAALLWHWDIADSDFHCIDSACGVWLTF